MKQFSGEDELQPLSSPFPFLKCHNFLNRYRRRHVIVTLSFLRLSSATTRVVVFLCIFRMSVCVCFSCMLLYGCCLAEKTEETHHHFREVVAATSCHRLPPSWWLYWVFFVFFWC